MGTLTLKDERVHIRAKDEVELYYKNERVEELDLSYESSGQPA